VFEYTKWYEKSWVVATGLNAGKQYLRLVIQHEGKRFDPTGEYVKRWVPELKDVHPEWVHRPWKLTEDQQIRYNVKLGVDYPHPIRDPTIADKRRRQRLLKRRGLDGVQNTSSETEKLKRDDWYGNSQNAVVSNDSNESNIDDEYVGNSGEEDTDDTDENWHRRSNIREDKNDMDLDYDDAFDDDIEVTDDRQEKPKKWKVSLDDKLTTFSNQ
jgi:hypothetical protein